MANAIDDRTPGTDVVREERRAPSRRARAVESCRARTRSRHDPPAAREATTLPGRFYHDPANLPGRAAGPSSPACGCASAARRMSPGPGDFLTRTVGQESVIVMRTGRGTSTPPQRLPASRLAPPTETSGTGLKHLLCPYHADVTSSTGRCRGAAHGGARNCDRRRFGLNRVGWSAGRVPVHHFSDGGRPAGIPRRMGTKFARYGMGGCARQAGHLRVGDQLEDALRELLGVLPLRPDPSRAEPGVALLSGEIDLITSHRGWLDGPAAGTSTDESLQRQEQPAALQAAGRGSPAHPLLHRDPNLLLSLTPTTR